MRWAFANSCLLCRDLWHFIKASSQTLLDWDHGMWLCSWRWSRSHKLNPFSFSLELFCTFHRNRTSQHVKGYKQHAPSNINTLFVVLDRFKSFLWGNQQAEDGEAFAVGWCTMVRTFFFLLPKKKLMTPSPWGLGNEEKSDTSIARRNNRGHLHDPETNKFRNSKQMS